MDILKSSKRSPTSLQINVTSVNTRKHGSIPFHALTERGRLQIIEVVKSFNHTVEIKRRTAESCLTKTIGAWQSQVPISHPNIEKQGGSRPNDVEGNGHLDLKIQRNARKLYFSTTYLEKSLP